MAKERAYDKLYELDPFFLIRNHLTGFPSFLARRVPRLGLADHKGGHNEVKKARKSGLWWRKSAHQQRSAA